jgi:hypothetical protein
LQPVAAVAASCSQLQPVAASCSQLQQIAAGIRVEGVLWTLAIPAVSCSQLQPFAPNRTFCAFFAFSWLTYYSQLQPVAATCSELQQLAAGLGSCL